MIADVNHAVCMQVPVVWWEDALWMRISGQLYNTLDQYEILGSTVVDMVENLTRSDLEEALITHHL